MIINFDQINDPINACEDVNNNMPLPPKIIHKSQEAYYNPSTDKINMPKMKSFSDSEGYYLSQKRQNLTICVRVLNIFRFKLKPRNSCCGV